MEIKMKIKKILLVMVLFLFVAGCGNKTAEEDKTAEMKKQVTELLKNDYQYALYRDGDLKLADGGIEVDGVMYYEAMIDSPLTIDEINNLPYKVFSKDTQDIFYKMLRDSRDFIFKDGKLYVHEKLDGCDIGTDFDFSNFSIVKTDDGYNVSFNGKEMPLYYEDNQYKLNYNAYNCGSVVQKKYEADAKKALEAAKNSQSKEQK
jgi:hypothetical protein